MHICVGKTFPCADGHSGKRLVDQKKKKRERLGVVQDQKKKKERELGWYKIIISKYSCLGCEPASVWEVFADFSECIGDSLKQTPPHTHTHTHTGPLLPAVMITPLVGMRRNARL